MSYLAEKLSTRHNRVNFTCGKESLDNYIRRQVSQDIKKRLAACFVIVDDNDEVQGYYTLSNASIPVDNAPEEIKSKIPRGYSDLPVTLLGRLAVHKASQGQNLGETLLIDALKRSYALSHTIASNAVIVDPLDTQAEGFYQKYGFIKLSSGKMFIPMKTIGELVRSD
jgi:predicted GNAT family N-acyltransferase